MRGKPHGALLLTGALGILIANAAVGQGVSAVISVEEERIQQAQRAQDQIDDIAETTRARFDEYQILLKEIDGLVVYNDLMQAQIDDQNRQLADLRESIDGVTVIERQILPLMTRMIDGLERFISFDVPFRLEERKRRVESLRQLLTRADVTTAEQFRNVMQAWQIENDYGRFADTYTGELMIGDVMREVDFLMVGRLSLYYVTPDNGLAGAWDDRERNWVALTRDDAAQIRQIISLLVSGTAPGNLFMLPVLPAQDSIVLSQEN